MLAVLSRLWSKTFHTVEIKSLALLSDVLNPRAAARTAGTALGALAARASSLDMKRAWRLQKSLVTERREEKAQTLTVGPLGRLHYQRVGWRNDWRQACYEPTLAAVVGSQSERPQRLPCDGRHYPSR